MKTTIFATISLLSLGLTGCINVSNWTQQVEGDGKIVTETRAVSQFDRVSIGGAGHLTLVQGDEESLTIETDSNFMPLIVSEVGNGRLTIGPHNANLKPTKSIEYRLKVKNLTELDCSGAVHAETSPVHAKDFALKSSGASHIQIEQLDSGKISIDASGAGHIEVKEIKANDLAVEISGAAKIALSGAVATQRVGVSGAGHYQGGDLKSDRANAHASGAGHATLWVNETLDAEASGAASIEYYGNPSGSHNHDSGAAHTRSLGKK
jgi:hypothetical protein